MHWKGLFSMLYRYLFYNTVSYKKYNKMHNYTICYMGSKIYLGEINWTRISGSKKPVIGQTKLRFAKKSKFYDISGSYHRLFCDYPGQFLENIATRRPFKIPCHRFIQSPKPTVNIWYSNQQNLAASFCSKSWWFQKIFLIISGVDNFEQKIYGFVIK